MMKKTLAAGTIALTLAGAGFALAQQTPMQAPAGARGGFHTNAEDAAAFTDARIAALKAGLQLTAEQQKNWPAVEIAIRELAKDRADRMKQREDRFAARREARHSGDHTQTGRDFVDRLRHGADAMTARAASLKKLADAAEPLYKSLDDGQKHRFAMLLRIGGRHHGFDGARHHHWQRRADAQ